MKRLIFAVVILAPAVCYAQSIPQMDRRVMLSGPTGLNWAMSQKVDTSNGVMTTPTMKGLLSALNGGQVQSVYKMVPALNAEIALGSATSPITTMGPSLRVSRTESLLTTDCNSTYNDNECNAAVAGIATGLPSDMMQTTGVYGGAVGSQTYKSDSQSTDNVGVQGQGREIGSGTGVGTGGFFQGINESQLGRAIGIEVNIKNLSGTDAPTNVSDGGGYPDILASCGAGTWASQWMCGSAVQITNSGRNFRNGVVVTDAIASDGAAFVDQSTGLTGLKLSGNHTNQIAGNNFNVTGSGNLWLGSDYNAQTTTHLNILSNDSNQAYFGAKDSSSAFVNIDSAGGGTQALFQFDDKSQSKWQFGKDADNSFILYDNVTGELSMRVNPSAPWYFQHGVDFPKINYADLPTGVTGNEVFCSDCYSSLRTAGSTKTGILVVYANGEWEDMVGNTVLH